MKNYNGIRRRGPEGKVFKILKVKSSYGFDVVELQDIETGNIDCWKCGHILKHILERELILTLLKED